MGQVGVSKGSSKGWIFGRRVGVVGVERGGVVVVGEVEEEREGVEGEEEEEGVLHPSVHGFFSLSLSPTGFATSGNK